MARAVSTYSSTWLSTNQSAHTADYRLRRYASTDQTEDVLHSIRYATFSPPTPAQDTQDATGPGTFWRNKTYSLVCDDTYYYRASASFSLDGVIFGTTKSFQTMAVDATAGAATASGATSSSITVNASFTPATKDNTAYAYVYYKLTSEPTTWTLWTSTYVDSGTGYSSNAIPATTVTGLSPATSYDFRILVYRPGVTNADKQTYGASDTLSTLDNTPTVTTDAATSVSGSAATLNGTVDHNSTDGALSWRYMTTASYTAPPDDAKGTEVSYSGNPITGDGSGSKSISGLAYATGYTFWAIYDPTGAGSTVFGSALAFTTDAEPGDPVAESQDEDLMITQYVDGIYGVATTVTFTLRENATTSTDSFYTSDAPSSGITIVKNGVYDSVLDNGPNLPTRVASVPQLYTLTLTAAMMQADVIDVLFEGGGQYGRRAHHIQVRTQKNLGTLVVNAASKSTNINAVRLDGNGSGAGLHAVAGDNDGMDIEGRLASNSNNFGTIAAYDSTTVVDLDNSTALDIADTYNGALILFTGGTGAGQVRMITDYVAGGAYRATLSPALKAPVSTDTTYVIVPGPDEMGISPGAMLADLPNFSSDMGDLLQLFFERMHNERNMTAIEMTLRNGDDSADLATTGVDNDGVTQTIEQLVDA